ncbi:g20 [Coccomyxa viridis]|uniref:G20 protein n=1 Tax=Coccomyxa viridis TaxID=1274662 RepID=A0ABP1FER3_9CHLO
MFACCALPRSHSCEALSKKDDTRGINSGQAIAASEGSLTYMQRYKEGRNAAEVTASSVSEAALDPLASTYESLKCNERVAQEDYIELITGSPASTKHLQVPQNVITKRTLQGKAYLTELGPAQPAANDARVATVLDLKKHMPSETARIDTLLELAVAVLGMETMLVSLLDGNRKFILAASGFITPGMSLDPPAICHWSLVPSLHQMIVVEDTLKDARTCNNPVVIKEPHLRFYCSAPLVASNGHRIGTICVVDKKPQHMDLDRAAILCNIAELVTREIEANWAAQQQRLQCISLLRTMESYKQAFMFVDVAVPGWKVLYMNDHAVERTGVNCWSRDGDTPFWSMFSLGDQAAPWKFFEEDIREKRVFTAKNLRSDSPHLSSSGRFNLIFRPATVDCLDDDHQMIGIPTTVSLLKCEITNSMFFVVVCPISRVGGRKAPPFENLKLSSQLGKGSYGRVYRGTYEGEPVAVKVINEVEHVRMESDGVPTEARLTQGLTHPSIVHMHAYKLLRNSRRDSLDDQQLSARAAPKSDELWLILEFCDRGSVQEAVDRGVFKLQMSPSAPPDVPVILTTATEIASGMAFLHEHGIVHGDLTGGNVLLHSSEESAHGFQAKISDFGMARDIGTMTKLETRTYGTITHMAPEVLANDYISKAADVYSFGVLCWEMLAGQRAWSGMNTAQIIHAVAIQTRQLQLPEDVMSPFEDLLQRCMAAEPCKRPTFTDIVSELRQLSVQTGGPKEEARMCGLSIEAPPHYLREAGAQHPICAA